MKNNSYHRIGNIELPWVLMIAMSISISGAAGATGTDSEFTSKPLEDGFYLAPDNSEEALSNGATQYRSNR